MALNLNDRNDLREKFILVPDLIDSTNPSPEFHLKPDDPETHKFGNTSGMSGFSILAK